MARERDDRDDRDDRPQRPRRDRDEDYDDRPREQLGPLDKTFRDTNIVVLVLFGVCCGMIAAILGLVGVLTAKDPKAKSNATIVLIVGGIMVVLSIVLRLTGVLKFGVGAR
jgi:hypothetical protein